MRPARRILSVVTLTLTLTLTFVLLIGATESVRACPNCKEAVSAQPSEVAGMAQGYNWSVLFMLAVPATLLGTGSLMVVRASRRGTLPEL
jgi:hypothetical protein